MSGAVYSAVAASREIAVIHMSAPLALLLKSVESFKRAAPTGSEGGIATNVQQSRTETPGLAVQLSTKQWSSPMTRGNGKRPF
eukprot:CAMPEP_0170589932 /NCGR_PEP_ID=MMETSP0224-20130122/11602_1 /TAXON_ID=285029 /ORGANISM="Togula jolla, Strain CCCM 725" /LENGTH=82 /DNA_ID=CAMNT_0010913699 /DNA_START=100 /DNA_END=348 /DNA_ORIENTATION=-